MLACSLLLLLALAGGAEAFAQDGPRLDILTICLATGSQRAEVVGIDVDLLNDETGATLATIPGRHTFVIAAGPGGLRIDNQLYPSPRLRLKSERNWLSYAGHVFREDLLIVRTPNKPDRFTLINELALEAYLYGLINKEVLPRWPLEAKKAQAVAARTYAVHRKLERPREQCDMGASVLDQVYGGYKAEDPAARQAVDETRGEVLAYHNRVARAYFHATCGGHTASLKETWGEDEAYLQGVECPFCKGAPNYDWTLSLPLDRFGAALGLKPAQSKRALFDVIERSESGRVLKVRLRAGESERILSGEELRGKLGFANLRSTAFTFSIQDGRITFAGHGSGHGVGLCQWGAANLAKMGSDYRTILQTYYPGTVIKRMYQ